VDIKPEDLDIIPSNDVIGYWSGLRR